MLLRCLSIRPEHWLGVRTCRYAFNQGPVHFLQLSTEVRCNSGEAVLREFMCAQIEGVTLLKCLTRTCVPPCRSLSAPAAPSGYAPICCTSSLPHRRSYMCACKHNQSHLPADTAGMPRHRNSLWLTCKLRTPTATTRPGWLSASTGAPTHVSYAGIRLLVI